MNLLRRTGGPGTAALGETLALLLLSPMIVSFTERIPEWDQLYFFHRAACVRNALQDLSFSRADICMEGLAKSPIMVATLLPSGPLHGTEGLAVGPIVLALATFALLWLGIRMAQRGGMKLSLAVAAAGIASLAPPLIAGAPFLADSISAIVILDTLLLLPLETATQASTGSAYFRRGLLWGLLFSLGLLSKLTYFYFAGVTFGLLVLISLYRDGIGRTAMKILGMATASLLPVLLFLRYSGIYWHHAMESAFGPLTAFYNDHIQRWAFLRLSFAQMGWAYWCGIALLLCYALVHWIRSRQTRGLASFALLFAIILGYLFIAAGSPNKDARFFWPVWLCLPFAVAAASNDASLTPVAVRGLGLAPVWLSIVLSVATAGRFDMHAVSKFQLVLQSLPHNRPIQVLMADDEAAYNVETLILARQLDLPAFRKMQVSTVVYDIVAGRTPAQSIKRLLGADYVILRWPVDKSSAEWANRFLPQFRAAIEAHGHLYRYVPWAGTDAGLCHALTGATPMFGGRVMP